MNLHAAEPDSSHDRVYSSTTTSECRMVEDGLDEYVLGVVDDANALQSNGI